VRCATEKRCQSYHFKYDITKMQNTTELHPIACLSCRHNHRKCERTLPACNQCLSRGKQCNYTNKKKVERKKPQITFSDETVKFKLPSKKDIEIAKTYNVNHHFDICLDNMLGYMPVLPMAKIRVLLEYLRDVSTNQEPSIPQPHDYEISLILAMQSKKFKKLINII
jgi:hypothetical protein